MRKKTNFDILLRRKSRKFSRACHFLYWSCEIQPAYEKTNEAISRHFRMFFKILGHREGLLFTNSSDIGTHCITMIRLLVKFVDFRLWRFHFIFARNISEAERFRHIQLQPCRKSSQEIGTHQSVRSQIERFQFKKQ